jgi:membrane protein implicated in regulation of membrane protease activity
MAEIALVVSVLSLLLGILCWFQIAAQSRGYRLMELWLGRRQIRQLEREIRSETNE